MGLSKKGSVSIFVQGLLWYLKWLCCIKFYSLLNIHLSTLRIKKSLSQGKSLKKKKYSNCKCWETFFWPTQYFYIKIIMNWLSLLIPYDSSLINSIYVVVLRINICCVFLNKHVTRITIDARIFICGTI